MTLYNLSELTDSGNVGGVATAANSYSDGILFGMGTIIFYFIMLLSLKRSNDFDEALLSSSLIMFVISGVFTYGGYVNIIFPLAYLAMTAFTGFFMWTTRTNY